MVLRESLVIRHQLYGGTCFRTRLACVVKCGSRLYDVGLVSTSDGPSLFSTCLWAVRSTPSVPGVPLHRTCVLIRSCRSEGLSVFENFNLHRMHIVCSEVKAELCIC